MLWRNTAVANLAPGQSVTLGKGLGTLGYEWDVDSDNGFRPAGEIGLSSTTENADADQVFNDYGTNVVPATVTHHLSLYKVASGAYVFGAGTVQFSYGLASSNPAGTQPDPNMEQFTVNLFALMGAQPSTLTSGLVPGSASTATGPPTSAIITLSGRNAHRRRSGHHQRNRHRHQRRGRGRRGGLDRRRHHLAPRNGHPRPRPPPGPTPGRARTAAPTRPLSRARHRRQRQHREAVRRREGQHQLPLLHLGIRLHPDRHRFG